jgi:hypothetical protein
MNKEISNRRARIQLLISFSLITSLLTFIPSVSYALTSETFNYTGGPQIYVVPEGVTTIAVTLEGAAGETPHGGGQGGQGGRVRASITVTPGEVLEIQVGGQGGSGNSYNGGGGGAGSGGGATDIRRPNFNTTSSCAYTLTCTYSDRIIVAGGGGGGGGYAGVPPVPTFVQGGAGGYTATNGAAWNTAWTPLPIGDATAGLAGTQSNGGVGGAGTTISASQAAGSGTFGVGGNAGWVANATGGGGGGGYYGGGGGGVSENSGNHANGAGGGGGGSSWAGGSGVTPDPTTPYENGVVSGNGSVTIDISSAIDNAAFGFTSAPQFYTVPAGTSALSVRLYGAGTGQTGDIVYGILPVTSGEILQLNIGGRGWADNRYAPTGTYVGQGGWNGGGDGLLGWYGQGGGGAGATDLRRCLNATLGTPCDLSTRMVVAGGGGAPSCGQWGLSGGNGGSELNGTGGDRSNPTNNPALVGGGGSLTAGGNAFGTPNAGETLTAGSLGQGGTALVSAQCGGGGGGGGLYGGGASQGDGGGGGSSCASITDTCTVTSNLLGITGAAFTHSQGIGGSVADGFAVVTAMPVATTGSVTQITSTSAVIAGTINPKYLASKPTLFYSTSQANIEACSAAGVVGNCPNVNSKYLSSNNGNWNSSSSLTLAGTSTQSINGSITGLSANSTYYYRICAQSVAGYGCGTTQSFSTQLTITNQSLNSGQVGTSYSETLTAIGGSGTYSQWSVTSGLLPVGIILDTTTGVIFGNPTNIQIDTITFQVTDSSNGTATRILSITITSAPPPQTPPIAPATPTQNQQSNVTSLSPNQGTVGSTTPIVLNGSFIEPIISIQVNGVRLLPGSWSQTISTVTFTLPNTIPGIYTIQIFNGATPLIPVQNFLVTPTTTPSGPTQTPNNDSTPQPNPETKNRESLISSWKLNIHFGMGEALINKANLRLMQSFVTKLNKLSTVARASITITAYTQPTPNNPDPESLAHKRAKAVEIALMKLGVKAHFTLLVGGNGPVNQSKYRFANILASVAHYA